MKRRLVYLVLFLGISIFLSPIVFKAFNFIVFDPIAYYWWRIKTLFQIVPQFVYWIIVIISVGLVFYYFLIRDILADREIVSVEVYQKGKIERLSEWIERSQKRYYFKWLLANRLAKLTLNVMNYGGYDPDLQRNDFESLDKNPPSEILHYLRSGLQESFLETNTRLIWISKPKTTSLDVDLNKVISFIETNME